jgi:hypothetical protein
MLCVYRNETEDIDGSESSRDTRRKAKKKKVQKLDIHLLLKGELTTVICGDCTLRRSEAEDTAGLLYITNYRLLFVAAKGEVVEGCNGCAEEAMSGEEFKRVYSVPLLELREVQSTETQGELDGKMQVKPSPCSSFHTQKKTRHLET